MTEEKNDNEHMLKWDEKTKEERRKSE